MKGQPDIIIVNHHEIYMYSEMCIDFQTPSNNYKIIAIKGGGRRVQLLPYAKMLLIPI